MPKVGFSPSLVCHEDIFECPKCLDEYHSYGLHPEWGLVKTGTWK